jgi:four helix bundle protein
LYCLPNPSAIFEGIDTAARFVCDVKAYNSSFGNFFMTSYKNLDAWKNAMQLVKEVYLLTKKFPKEELYALTSQTKRVAVSIPSNIAEGLGRQYKKDTLQFLHISRGSLYELETLLNIAVMVEIITEDEFNKIIPALEKALQVLNGFINYNQKADLK